MKAPISDLRILLPENHTEQAAYAAAELRHYLGLMTGQIFEISADGAAPAISVDRDDTLGADDFTLRTENGVLNIRGGVRGVIYGAYELLERLGCRFFTATCEKIPRIDGLTLPELDERHGPAFEYRDHNYCEPVRYSRFAVKLRLNGGLVNIRPKHGGNMRYARFVHTFQELVSPKLYGAEHPEYFALFDGERCVIPDKNQLCLTNPDVLEIAAESARRILRENPQARILSLSQNDWGRGCECEACRASDRALGSPAGTLLKFVNAIAERLEPEFPDVIFDTLAYNYTRPIPTTIRPRHNVCVRLCSIEACFAHPFETCDDDRSVVLPDGSRHSFITDLRDWGTVCDRMYIWDYTTCFANYPSPHPNWHVLQPNMQAFAKNNVKGVFEQANGASFGGTDFNELRAYVISKLLWDPDTDVDRHIREFTDEFYGAAAPMVREYIDYFCGVAERENIHVGFNDNPDSDLFRDEVLDRLQAILDRAKAAVSGDALRLWRITKAELSVRWVRLKRRTMLEDNMDPDEMNRFFTDWRAFGLTRIDEWCSQETTFRAMLHGLWRGTEFYDHWNGDGGEEL